MYDVNDTSPDDSRDNVMNSVSVSKCYVAFCCYLANLESVLGCVCVGVHTFSYGKS